MKFNQPKSKYIPISVVAATLISFSISCKSPEKHADSAFDILKHKKEMQGDSGSEKAEVIVKSPLPVITEKTETMDEWTKFKNGCDKKIKSNDLKIEQIFKLKSTSDKTLKHLAKLKAENNEFHLLMYKYKEEEKVRYENFKTSLEHDINTIEIELKDVNSQLKK